MSDPYSRLQIFGRIVALPDDGDDYRRRHRRTQAGKPHQAKQWLKKARRLHLVSRLISSDERFAESRKRA